MRTVHFIYTVPRGSLFHRAWNRAAGYGLVPRLYRTGHDALIPWKHPIRAPHSISYHMLHALKERYRVRFYSAYEHGVCDTKAGDIVIAHPVPVLPHVPPREIDKESVTYRTFYEKHDITKVIMMPYSHDAQYTAWWSDLVRDHGKNCIFLSGKIWMDTWERSPFKDLDIRNKFRMDMGLDLRDYPRVKTSYNAPGTRGYLYVGHTGWYKNIAELERIAAAMPGYRFGHIGSGKIQGWDKISEFADLTPSFMGDVGRDYDVFVNASYADPQVTTVLEHMALGFLVACTPESGYSYPSLQRLSIDDTAFNRAQLEALQQVGEADIEKRIADNVSVLRANHSWDTVTRNTITFIESL